MPTNRRINIAAVIVPSILQLSNLSCTYSIMYSICESHHERETIPIVSQKVGGDHREYGGHVLTSGSMFTSLPIGCWMGILDFLEPNDVFSLSAVSQDFYSSNMPFLYHEISWEWDAVPLARILRLLRTVLQKPELASLIKDVTLKSPQQNVDRNSWKDSVKFEAGWKEEAANHMDVVESAQDLVKKAEFPDYTKWIDALQDGNVYAFAAILLSQLHNLATLRLDYSFVWKSGFPGLMPRHALFTSPEGLLSKFESLATVDYGSNVLLSEEYDPIFTRSVVEGYPPCEPKQFMA